MLVNAVVGSGFLEVRPQLASDCNVRLGNERTELEAHGEGIRVRLNARVLEGGPGTTNLVACLKDGIAGGLVAARLKTVCGVDARDAGTYDDNAKLGWANTKDVRKRHSLAAVPSSLVGCS